MSDETMERLAKALGDRYAIEGEIDRGGMAVVYLARDPKHGGGLSYDDPLPEVAPFDFAPRVETPVLMINGEHDIVFPYETTQKPLS